MLLKRASINGEVKKREQQFSAENTAKINKVLADGLITLHFVHLDIGLGSCKLNTQKFNALEEYRLEVQHVTEAIAIRNTERAAKCRMRMETAMNQY
jgi:hypothetical protein